MSIDRSAVVLAALLVCSLVAATPVGADSAGPGPGSSAPPFDATTAGGEATAPALVVSRDTVPVGSPVSLGVTGEDVEVVEWTLASSPPTSASAVVDHGRTATLRPDVPGEYVVRARTATNETLRATVTTDGTRRLSLLRRYAPVLSFHENETYYPTRLESFVYNARLETLGAPDTDEPNTFSLANRSDDWELDLDDGDFTDYDDRYPPTVYGSVHRNVTFRGESYTALTYWLFYVYDPKQPGSVAGLLAHQSDLETVTVLVNDSGPQWLGASQHYGGEVREWRNVDRDDTHPRVFPAVGAHSNYLRNTARYDGRGILPQRQFVNESSTNTTLFEPALGVYADHTGNATVWTADGSVGTEYQVAVLTGSEVWATYEGTLGPDDGTAPVPTQRARWRRPGRWMNRTLAPDERQLAAQLDRAAVAGDDADITGRATVTNTGPKPATLHVVLEAKRPEASWADGSVVVNATAVPVGTERAARVFLRGSPPDPGEWDARLRLAAYPRPVADEEEIIDGSDPTVVAVTDPTNDGFQLPFEDVRIPGLPSPFGSDPVALVVLVLVAFLVLATGDGSG